MSSKNRTLDDIAAALIAEQAAEQAASGPCEIFAETANSMATNLFQRMFGEKYDAIDLKQKTLLRSIYYTAMLQVIGGFTHLVNEHEDPEDAHFWLERLRLEGEMFVKLLKPAGFEGAALGLAEAAEKYAALVFENQLVVIDFDPDRDPSDLFQVRPATEEELELAGKGHLASRRDGGATVPIDPATGVEITDLGAADPAAQPVPERASPADQLAKFLESWDPAKGKGGRA